MTELTPGPLGTTPRVTMYTKWGCGYCMWARRLLESKGLDVEQVSVTFKPKKFREMLQRSGGRKTAPQIFIDDFHVGGYRELVDFDRGGHLDALLEELKAGGEAPVEA